MSYSHNFPANPVVARVPRVVPQASLVLGGVGAVIGGTAALAKNIRRVNNGEIKRDDAVKDTIKEAAGAGLATTVASAAVGAMGFGGVLSLAGIVVLATGTKYLWDAATASEKAPAPAPKESAEQD